MKYVVERRDAPPFYAGFLDGVPVWTHTRGRATQFEHDLAVRVTSQLNGLGFKVEMKELGVTKERRRVVRAR